MWPTNAPGEKISISTKQQQHFIFIKGTKNPLISSVLIFVFFSSLSPQAFVPNQVKPYICTTEVPPALICQIQDQAQGLSGNKNFRQKISITKPLLHR